MKILSEKEEMFVNWNLELSKKEFDLLIKYSILNMPEETYRNLQIEWSLIDILKKQLEK